MILNGLAYCTLFIYIFIPRLEPRSAWCWRTRRTTTRDSVTSSRGATFPRSSAQGVCDVILIWYWYDMIRYDVMWCSVMFPSYLRLMCSVFPSFFVLILMIGDFDAKNMEQDLTSLLGSVQHNLPELEQKSAMGALQALISSNLL